MYKRNVFIAIAVLFISISIALSGYFIGEGLRIIGKKDLTTTIVATDNMVLDLTQVANYLKMTEEEITGIIQTEKNKLEETGSFYGRMFPYFVVNNNKYFYKDEVNEWLKEVSSNRREYDTKSGWILR